MTLSDAHYKHWQGQHLGIWHRRWAITANGVATCFQIKAAGRLVGVCWIASLLAAAILFVLGQLLVADSIVVQWLGNLNPQLQGLARALTTWLEKHPEISVRTTYDLLFYFFSSQLATMTFIMVALTIPSLLTRDLSSNAIIIYQSKALNRFDYLLGKFGTVFIMMTLTWLGPLLMAWFAGNLLSTQWHFFWHSRLALAHTVLVVVPSMVVLGVVAMGISALSPNTRTTTSLWVGLWLLGNALVPLSQITKPWLKFFSISYDLKQISLSVFQLQNDLELLQKNLPMLGGMLPTPRGGQSVFDKPETTGAVCGLLLLAVLAVLVLRRKAKAD